jgi:hypothetical protein
MQADWRRQWIVRAGVVCLFSCLVAPAWAQNDALQKKISRTGNANHEARLSGHVRVDRNCASIGAPQIYLAQPPVHGVLCLRRGEVRLEYLVGNAPRNCLGQKAAGVRVFYHPYDDYTGKDEARYVVQFPHDQVSVEVDLTIVPDDRPSLNGAMPAAGTPVQETQKPGVLPACAELVS